MIKYVDFTKKQLKDMIFIDESGKVQVPVNPPKGITYLFEDNSGYYSVLLVLDSGEIHEQYVLFSSKF